MRFAGVFLTLAAVAACGQPPQTTTSPVERSGSRIELLENRFLDMHYVIRALAEVAEDKRPEPMRAAVKTAAEIENSLGGQMAWGILEGSLMQAEDIAAARRIAEKLPAEFQSMSGATLPLRELAQKLLDAYEPIERDFVERTWPDHQRKIAAARKSLAADLLPLAARCIEYIEKSLDMKDGQQAIPVYLVASAPWPGGFTHRRRGGGGVCIVGVDQKPELLVETALHECIHALDISTQSQPTVLNELRKKLQQAGHSPRSELMRSVPHTLIFVQAGETVRRMLNPQHRHYGDTAGYYARVPEATNAVREPWTAHLEGKMTTNEAVARMVEKTPRP